MAIAKSAAHSAEAQTILDELSLELLNKISGSKPHTLSVIKLLQLSSAKIKLVLRYWIQREGHLLPDTKKIIAIENNVLTAEKDRMPLVKWGKTEIRRFRDDLYVMNCLPTLTLNDVYQWDLLKPLRLPGIGVLSANKIVAGGLRVGIAPISIRFRKGGEVVHFAGHGHHTLKNLLQEWNVPPWERDRIPLIFLGEELVGVVGYFLDKECKAKEGEVGYEVRLEKEV